MINVLTVGVYQHIFDAVGDFQVTLMETTHVAGVKPPVPVNGCLGFGRFVPISFHYAMSPDKDLALGAVEAGIEALVGLNSQYFVCFHMLDADFNPRYDPPHRSDHLLFEQVDSDYR